MIDASFEVVNMIAGGKLPAELALDPLAEDLNGTAWKKNPNQPGLYHRFEDDGPLTTFYTSGKYIIRAPNEEKLYETDAAIKAEIARLGIIPDENADTEFSIHNVVANGRLYDAELDENGEQVLLNLDLMYLTEALGLKYCLYDPESFPSLTVRRPEFPCTFLLFATGKAVITGGKSVEESRVAFDQLVEELEEWGC
jgi:transcription initiation factor TFIID TATA-box-binding protein